MLAAFPKFSDFHGAGSRQSSAKSQIVKKIDDKSSALLSNITFSGMTAEAQLVAKTLLEGSKNFAKALLQYMVTQMEEYGKDTTLSETRCWELTQAITRIIFSVLSEKRLAASEVTIAEALDAARGAQLIWGALQCHKAQDAFLASDFKNHTAIAPLLMQYLLDIVAFKDDLDSYKNDAAKALEEATSAKRKSDNAESKAQLALVEAKKPRSGGNTGGNTGRGGRGGSAASTD